MRVGTSFRRRPPSRSPKKLDEKWFYQISRRILSYGKKRNSLATITETTNYNHTGRGRRPNICGANFALLATARLTLDNDMENPTAVTETTVSISLPCVKEGGLRSKTEGL